MLSSIILRGRLNEIVINIDNKQYSRALEGCKNLLQYIDLQEIKEPGQIDAKRLREIKKLLKEVRALFVSGASNEEFLAFLRDEKNFVGVV
jgi:hypothetical protein